MKKGNKFTVEPWALEDLLNDRDIGDLTYPEWQREPFAWCQDDKEKLVKTVLNGEPVDPLRILLGKAIEDGQQRLEALRGFYRGKFGLSNEYSTQIIADNYSMYEKLISKGNREASRFRSILDKYNRGSKVNLYFDDLPPELRKAYKRYKWYAFELNDEEYWTDDRAIDHFVRIQNGANLEKGELLYGLSIPALIQIRENLYDDKLSEILKERLGLTAKRRKDFAAVVGIAACYEGYNTYGGKKFTNWVMKSGTYLSDMTVERLKILRKFFMDIEARRRVFKIDTLGVFRLLCFYVIEENHESLDNMDISTIEIILNRAKIFRHPEIKSFKEKIEAAFPDGYPSTELQEKYIFLCSLMYNNYTKDSAQKGVRIIKSLVNEENKYKEVSFINRSQVLSRLLTVQQGRCAHCGILRTIPECEIDHATPLSQGGTNDFSNFQAVCKVDAHNSCKINQIKSDRIIMEV